MTTPPINIKQDGKMDEIYRNKTPMQLFAILDDPEHSERDDCTQFVMEAKETLVDAMDFLSTEMAPDLWGVSRVKLVGIVPLATCDNRTIKARKVMSTFPLERIFVQGHQDCLLVEPDDDSGNHNVTMDDEEESINTEGYTEDFTDDPTNERINYLLGSPASDDDVSTTEEDDDGVTTDDDADMLATLPRHLLTGAGTSMISMADTEAESTTPLTGEEANTSQLGDDASSPSSSANGNHVTDEALATTQSGIGQDITPDEVEQEAPETQDKSTSRTLPVETQGGNKEQANSVPPPVASSTNTPLDNVMVTASATDAKPTTSSTDGNSIGLAYDVPIESEGSGDEAAAATLTSATKTDLPPWANNGTTPEEKNEEKDESNAGAIAAGVAAGTVAAGAIAAGVLASSENDESAAAAADDNDQVAGISEAVPKEQGVDSRTSVRAGPHVAEMVSLFETEGKGDTVPVPQDDPDDTAAVKKAESEDRNEVHLLDGFTTEEDDDDLFKPEIPQNLKTKGGSSYRNGDSEFDGIEEERSVKTQEFPDDDTTAAASFDNVLVVDLHDASSEMKGAEVGATPENTPIATEKELVAPVAGEGAVADSENDKVSVKKETEPTPPSTTVRAADEVAGDVPAKTNTAKKNEAEIPAVAVPAADKEADDVQASAPAIPVANDSGFDASGEIEGFDSWRTDGDTQDEEDEPNSFLPPKERTSKKEKSQEEPSNSPVTFPSLLGNSSALDWENNSDTEGEPLLLGRDTESDAAAAPPVVAQTKAAPTISYKIGSTYFLLRERDGIEYPVKILSLSKRGTCIVEYEHHRAKKKIRTSSLLPDTPERRAKFDEQLKTGQIAKDLPDRISKELKQRQSERHARHEERRRYGSHISREDLPTCSTEGTIIEFKSRRVYFANDKETISKISKKFSVPTDRIIYDNKAAYPTLKKSSRLRPLTSIVLPPA